MISIQRLHSDRLYRAAYNIRWNIHFSAVQNLAFKSAADR